MNVNVEVIFLLEELSQRGTLPPLTMVKEEKGTDVNSLNDSKRKRPEWAPGVLRGFLEEVEIDQDLGRKRERMWAHIIAFSH